MKPPILAELRVLDLAMIKDANLQLGSGLTVLTGETGAGKTALLGACKLLVGERADAQLVRAGADEARVEAVFEGQDGAEQIVIRRVNKDGRSRCSLNDSICTVGTLVENIGPLLDLYGQHDHQSLLKPIEQLRALDSFGGKPLLQALSVYRQAYAHYTASKTALDRLSESAASASLRHEQADFVLREINAIDPKPGEYLELEHFAQKQGRVVELEAAVQAVFANLRDDGRVLDLLAEGKQALDGLKGIDPRLDGFAATLADLTAVAEDLAQDIRSYAAEVDSDPEVLSQTLTRLQAIDGLVRRFGPRIEDVFNARESAIRTLEETSDIDLAIAKATSQVDQAQKELRAAALRLSELRAEVAARFSEELTDAARDLAMPTASFSIDLRPLAEDSWTVNGAESIEIIYSPAALQPFRSLQKIASGGELSRVMLAIKSLNARENQGITMVFDEIDAGIGGAVALKVAQRLKALAKHNQLLVVTHLAQIAACADDHWLVAKVEQDGSTVSTISRVEGEKRVQEIARMLAGSVDALSCEHAMKLINDSRGTDG